MAKIKIYNESGRPVEAGQLEAHETEFKSEFDKLWALKESGSLLIEDFKIELDKVDKRLRSKYRMYKVEELPKSKKGWVGLLAQYGATVKIGVTEENGEVIIILEDSLYD